jgi:hypothetical protein
VKSKEIGMSKEILKVDCRYCESAYKLIYDASETSGHPKVCSFCGSDLDMEDDYDEDEED